MYMRLGWHFLVPIVFSPLFLWVFFHELSQARKNLWVFLKCVMLIFIETVLIIEMNVHRKPLMAASVLTLEVNSGVDIWSSESDDTSTLLAAHTPSLWVYGWALSHSVADSDHRFFFFPQQSLLMRGIKGDSGWKLIHGLVNLWLMRPIASPRHCIDSAEWTGNWPSSHWTLSLAPVLFIPNRTFVPCSFILKSLTFISFYIPSWFFTIRMESGQIDVFI